MARANGQGRNWARSLSMVLFGVATLDLTGAFGTPGIQVEFVPVLFGPALPVLTWLVGLAAVWLLWRPASTAYFKPQGGTPGPARRTAVCPDSNVQLTVAAPFVSRAPAGVTGCDGEKYPGSAGMTWTWRKTCYGSAGRSSVSTASPRRGSGQDSRLLVRTAADPGSCQLLLSATRSQNAARL